MRQGFDVAVWAPHSSFEMMDRMSMGLTFIGGFTRVVEGIDLRLRIKLEVEVVLNDIALD